MSRAQRVPPPMPKRPDAPSNTEWKRYLHRLKAWFAGELLRALAAHLPAPIQGEAPADYPLPPMTANYAALGMPRATTVTDQMSGLIAYLDEQESVYRPLRTALLALYDERPAVVAALWRKHILLQSIPQIARAERCSERTVQYLLACGNGRLFTEYCLYAKVDGRLRKMASATDRFLAHLMGLVDRLDKDPTTTLDMLALAGAEAGEGSAADGESASDRAGEQAGTDGVAGMDPAALRARYGGVIPRTAYTGVAAEHTA